MTRRRRRKRHSPTLPLPKQLIPGHLSCRSLKGKKFCRPRVQFDISYLNRGLSHKFRVIALNCFILFNCSLVCKNLHSQQKKGLCPMFCFRKHRPVPFPPIAILLPRQSRRHWYCEETPRGASVPRRNKGKKCTGATLTRPPKLLILKLFLIHPDNIRPL